MDNTFFKAKREKKIRKEENVVGAKLPNVPPHLKENHYKISQFYRRKNSVGVWLEVRRWFFYRRHHRQITSVGFPFVGDSPFRRYIGRKNKKTICRWFYRRNLRAKKRRFPLEIYRRICIPSVILWLTNRN